MNNFAKQNLVKTFDLTAGEEFYVMSVSSDGRWANGWNKAGKWGFVATENLETKVASTTYTIKSGDTLWNLWQQFGGNMSWADWLAKVTSINNINNPGSISIGTVLTLPSLA